MKIYVAGPLTAETDEKIMENVQFAIEVGRRLMQKGHLVFIPHLFHFMDPCTTTGDAQNWSFAQWMAFDLAWVRECDALFCISSSQGTNMEVIEAGRYGKPIFHSINEVPDLRCIL